MSFRKYFPVFLLILVAQAGYSQDDLSTVYANTITEKGLYDKLSIIASDAMEGRETGERGQKMAAAFIQYTFQKAGLTGPVKDSRNPYYQEIPLVFSKAGNTWLSVKKEKLDNMEDFIYFGSASMDFNDLEVVFAGSGSSEDYQNTNVKGKGVILMLNGSRSRGKTDSAYIMGAQFVLAVPTNSDDEFGPMMQRYSRFLRGSLRLDDGQAREENKGLALISPSTAAGILNTTVDKLVAATSDLAAAKKIGKGKITFHSEQITEKVTSENVLGYMEGTDKKDELVVITAHYDHIGRQGDQINNGADDDGSGTSSVMQIAEAFAQAKRDGHGPRRSILFMTVAGEEKGLLGSQYYTSHPVFPLESTVVDLNIDMIGRVDPNHKDNPNYVYLVGSDRLSSELHQISEKVNTTYDSLDLDYTYNDEANPERIYYRSDHWNFAKNNVPIIFYFNGTHEDYHRPTDTIDKINFDIMIKRAQLVFHTAWVLANREDRIVVDKIQSMPVDNR